MYNGRLRFIVMVLQEFVTTEIMTLLSIELNSLKLSERSTKDSEL